MDDPLYCDDSTPCTDPARPFCDLTGEHPASGGIGKTCIPDPFPDAGQASDAGPGGDAGTEPLIRQIVSGSSTTCAVLRGGRLRCWGSVQYGEQIGDDELPSEAEDVPTGGPVAEVSMGESFICTRYENGDVRCWGTNLYGRCGYGHTESLEGMTPAELPNVSLGGPARQIVSGIRSSCALLESGDVRCWGYNHLGQLGYGHLDNIGDDELPSSVDPVRVGGAVRELIGASNHVCAILVSGDLRCWGNNSAGQLGYGTVGNVGDDEHPAQKGAIDVGGTIVQYAAAGNACVLLEGGSVRCWGAPGPSLGHPTVTENIGDDEPPSSLGPVDLGGPARWIAAGTGYFCAVLESGAVRCWGGNSISGNSWLGYGDGEMVGDDERPAQAGDIEIGGRVQEISTGAFRSSACAIMENEAVRCWGSNDNGQLGYGHTQNIGDDEHPESAGEVQFMPDGER